MNGRSGEFLEIFKNTILPFAAARLVIVQASLSEKNILAFNDVALTIIKDAMYKLCEEANVYTTRELDGELFFSAVCTLLQSLNGVLPLDYPYILGLVRFTETNEFKVICLTRNKIQLAEVLTRPDALVIVFAKTEEEFLKGKKSFTEIPFAFSNS